MQSAQPVRTITAAVLALALQAAAPAKPPRESASREIDPYAQEAAVELAVDDILQARESLGLGPLGDGEAFRPIAGLADESTEEATPADAQREILGAEMRRMIQDHASQPTAPKVARAANDPIRRADERALRREIEALRTAAFQMDQAAHRLECLRSYRRADQLRQLAGELRTDARGLDRPSFPSSASREWPRK